MGVHSPEAGLIPTETVPTNVADILTAAADLIEPEGAWTKGHAARKANGDTVAANDPSAVCWCAVGALQKVCRSEINISYEAFDALLDVVEMPADTDPALLGEVWNDAPERTQAEVVAALRAAAEKARTADTNKLAGDEGEAGVTP